MLLCNPCPAVSQWLQQTQKLTRVANLIVRAHSLNIKNYYYYWEKKKVSLSTAALQFQTILEGQMGEEKESSKAANIRIKYDLDK